MSNLANDIAVRIAKEYFARLDAGSAQLLDLFTTDAQIYFPKFGIGRGHAAQECDAVLDQAHEPRAAQRAIVARRCEPRP